MPKPEPGGREGRVQAGGLAEVAARVRVAPDARVVAADAEPGHRALWVLPRQPGGQATTQGQPVCMRMEGRP